MYSPTKTEGLPDILFLRARIDFTSRILIYLDEGEREREKYEKKIIPLKVLPFMRRLLPHSS